MNAITETPVVDDWEVNGPSKLREDGVRRDRIWLSRLSGASLICSIIALSGYLGWLVLLGLIVSEDRLKPLFVHGNLFLRRVHTVEVVVCVGIFLTFLCALLGLSLAGATSRIAQRDRTARERGERNPSGLPQTIAIQRRARLAMLFNTLGVIPGLPLLGLLLAMLLLPPLAM